MAFITAIFKGYISGFEPLVMNWVETHTRLSHSLNFIVRNLAQSFSYR